MDRLMEELKGAKRVADGLYVIPLSSEDEQRRSGRAIAKGALGLAEDRKTKKRLERLIKSL